MRRLIFLSLILGVTSMAKAQTDPVSWNFTSKKLADKSYEVHLTATIEKGWHIYSQTTPAGGPIPTAFVFTKNPLLTFGTLPKESGKLEQHNEPLFGVNVKQYSDKVEFIQTVKVKAAVIATVKGTVEFMVCNDKTCLPPKVIPFSVALK
ncbi:MAG: protein-disulfide reductase DsbD domain-containing protein [Chitinophagaceae bacterium]